MCQHTHLNVDVDVRRQEADSGELIGMAVELAVSCRDCEEGFLLPWFRVDDNGQRTFVPTLTIPLLMRHDLQAINQLHALEL